MHGTTFRRENDIVIATVSKDHGVIGVDEDPDCLSSFLTAHYLELKDGSKVWATSEQFNSGVMINVYETNEPVAHTGWFFNDTFNKEIRLERIKMLPRINESRPTSYGCLCIGDSDIRLMERRGHVGFDENEKAMHGGDMLFPVIVRDEMMWANAWTNGSSVYTGWCVTLHKRDGTGISGILRMVGQEDIPLEGLVIETCNYSIAPRIVKT